MNFIRSMACVAVFLSMAGVAGAQTLQPIESGKTVAPASDTMQPTSQPTSAPTTRQAIRASTQITVDPATDGGPVTITPTSRPASRPTTQASQPATKPAENIADSKALYNQGHYSAAADGFRKFMSADPVAASIGLAETLSIQGQYDKAMEALTAAAAEGEKSAEWHLAMYDVLTAVGKYDDALNHAAKARQLKPVWAPAIYANGQALEMLGKKDQARDTYKTMDRVVAGDAWKTDARSLVALGNIMDRMSILTQKKASEQATNILQNYIQQAYLKADPKYWPANVAAGVFLLNNHRPKPAMDELNKANKINPSIPDVFVGRAAASLGAMNFEECLKQAELALAINPKSCDAFLLKAACMMQWRKYDEVEGLINKALEVNPNNLDALSQMAAMHITLGHADKADPFIARVKAVNPNYAGLPTTIGDCLTTAKQYKEAEPYFQEAIKMAPELAGPKTSLGLMYLQTGQEDKALAALLEARKLDDFREDVVNRVNLLKVILNKDRFQVKETEHFVVKVDNDDAVMLDLVSDYMEGIYEEVCRDFDYKLPDKTYIEFFPTHQDFSVRLTGRAGIPTIGACTGNVIAMAAPDEAGTGAGGYNWAVVLRHEYTHAVTLAATKNRIPHWFTEAFAVRSQPDRRSAKNIMVLVNAVKSNQLLPVKDLDWGFIRPKSMGQRTMAYGESEWMLEYIILQKDYETAIKMLKAFADGMTQKEVFEKIVGMPEEEFDKNFQAWAKEQVRNEWKMNPDPNPDLRKLTEEAKARPNDETVQADYAASAMAANALKPAEEAARKALAVNPNNVKALGVLAYVLVSQKKFDEAIGMAKRLEEIDHTSIQSPKILAQCYLEKRNFPEAIISLELLKQRQPIDLFAYQELANMYNSGDPDKELPNLLELHKLTMTDPKYARQIAGIYRRQGQDENALRFLRQVTYLNPYDNTVYGTMASIHMKAKRYPQAISAINNLCLLEPGSAKAWASMASIEYQVAKATGDKAVMEKAKESAEKSVKIEPEGQGKQILERIETAMKG